MRIRRLCTAAITLAGIAAVVFLTTAIRSGSPAQVVKETMAPPVKVDDTRPNPAISREVFDALTELSREWKGQDAGRVAVASGKP